MYYKTFFSTLPKKIEPFFLIGTPMNRKAGQDPLLSLLRQTADGDRKSFQVLYEETNHRLKVYLYRLIGDRACIDDILIETYTQVWKSSATFQGRSLVMSWMIGIARNVAFREMGRRQYHDNLDDHPELIAREIDTDAGSRKEILCRALAGLKPRQREILDLAFFHDLPYREISHILDIPENTVKTRVFHAKAALKTQLEKMGIDSNDL